MKSPLLQLIGSAVVLGVMGGAVTIHALHVSGARELGGRSGWPADSAVPGKGGSLIAPTSGMPLREGSDYRPGAGGSNREMGTMVVALEEIVTTLRELNTENRTLMGQMEETNRDLMEMQFRVDTLSESFRPLKIPSGDSSPLMLLPPKGP
jgi:hypothetical protein